MRSGFLFCTGVPVYHNPRGPPMPGRRSFGGRAGGRLAAKTMPANAADAIDVLDRRWHYARSLIRMPVVPRATRRPHHCLASGRRRGRCRRRGLRLLVRRCGLLLRASAHRRQSDERERRHFQHHGLLMISFSESSRTTVFLREERGQKRWLRSLHRRSPRSLRESARDYDVVIRRQTLAYRREKKSNRPNQKKVLPNNAYSCYW